MRSNPPVKLLYTRLHPISRKEESPKLITELTASSRIIRRICACCTWGGRLEAMREGIEDYELLRVAAAKDPARAHQIAAEAIPNITDYTRDVATFRRLQEQLVAAAE